MTFRFFFPVCGLSVYFLDGVIWSTKLFNFDEVQFIDVYFIVGFFFSVESKNFYPTEDHED